MQRLTPQALFLLLVLGQVTPVQAGGLQAPVMLPEIDTSDLAPPFALAVGGDAVYFSGLGPERWQTWSLRDGVASPIGVNCPEGGGVQFQYVQLPGTTVGYISEGCDYHGTHLGSIDTVTGVAGPVVNPDLPPPTYGWGLTRLGDRALLSYDDGTLWSTDGTDEGTWIVHDFERSLGFITPVGTWAILGAGGPWRTDGTAAGTFQLASGVSLEQGSLPWPGEQYLVPTFVRLGGRTLFYGKTADEGLELWSTDGTSAGTLQISTLRPGTETVGVGPLVPCRDVAYFGSDGVTPAGYDRWPYMWRTDGTPEGTYPIGDDPGDGWRGVTASPIGCLGSSVVVLHWDVEGDTQHLAISDGTLAGTHPLLEVGFNVDIGYEAKEYHGWLFFPMALTDEGHGRELWATDGTPAGTFRTADIAPGADDSNPRELTALGDSLYFVANDGIHNDEIWRIVIDPTLVFRDDFESATLSAWNQPTE